MIKDSNEHTNNSACHKFTVTSPNERPKPSVKELSVNSKIKIDILGITASQVVTIVGTPS